MSPNIIGRTGSRSSGVRAAFSNPPASVPSQLPSRVHPWTRSVPRASSPRRALASHRFHFPATAIPIRLPGGTLRLLHEQPTLPRIVVPPRVNDGLRLIHQLFQRLKPLVHAGKPHVS